LVGALMAIPIAAALKVVLAERLHARDAADADNGESRDPAAAVPPGSADDAMPAPTPAGDTTPTSAAPGETSPALASADVTALTPAPTTTDRNCARASRASG